MSQSTEELQVAVDTGGTFTDIGVRDADGALSVWKVPSTPHAPDEAVLDGIHGALEQQGASPAQITRLVHGTTVATNTVLTRDGARVGLVTTKGFRDVLAIAHQARPSLYDNTVHRPTPLVPGELIVEVTERIDADGAVLTAPSPDELAGLASSLAELELDSIVVSFLNAYSNPEHEQQVTELLRQANAAPIVLAATSISAEMREYDRTSTATINAYIQPKMSAYMGRLNEEIEKLDIPSRLWIMQSNGGLLNPQTAAEHSARTVLSGLAGGVVGAANWAHHLDLPKVVSFDIGGTSTDIALIRNGQPDETTATSIDSLPLRLPSVDVHTIGAGGGSVAWRDAGGSLRVGPHSAGADPGPVAYQRGGEDLTVTDAHVVLGRLGTELLGGRFPLDRDAALARMTAWGEELGLSAEDAAEGIIKVITATMARGIRKVSIERGIDVRDCHLMAFGGAGPLHGADLTFELGMRSAVIPPLPGIASAVGMLDAPIRHDFALTRHADFHSGLGHLAPVLDQLREQARAEIGREDFDEAFTLDTRYIGQSYELAIPYTEDFEELRRAFDETHEERYGFSDADADLEVVVVRLSATIGLLRPELQPVGAGPEQSSEPKAQREVYIEGAWRTTPIFDRDRIPPGTVLAGPAILDQFDTTTFIRPGQECRFDDYGFLHLTPASAGA